MPERRLFRVYIDEAGDRGSSANSSPFFLLAAVVVTDTAENGVRSARDDLCRRLNKPEKTVLHWSQNIKRRDERRLSSATLGQQRLRIAYVLVHKATAGTNLLNDHVAMYNYALRRLLERVSWLVDDHGGRAILTYAHVKKFPYSRLASYHTLLQNSVTEIRWQAMPGRPKRSTPDETEMLQFADIAAGCLYAAVTPDRFGHVDGTFLLDLGTKVYRRPGSDVRSYGLNVVGQKSCLEELEWWSQFQR